MKKNLFSYAYIACAIIGIVAATAIIVYASLNFSIDTTEITKKNVTIFSTGWSEITDSGEMKEIVSLPKNVEIGNDNTVTVCNTIPKNVSEGYVLNFSTSYENVEAYIGQKLVYSFGMNRKSDFGKSFGIAWNFIPLSNSDVGKTIKIVIHNENNTSSTVTIPSVTIGDRASTVVELLRTRIRVFTISICMMLTGILLLIISFLIKKKYEVYSVRSIVYLSLFILLIAIWLITDSGILWIFMRKTPEMYFVSFFSFMWMPVPILLFIREICIKHHKSLLMLSLSFIINIIIQSILLVSNVFDLPQMLFLTHFLYIVMFVAVTLILLIECFKQKNNNVIDILVGLFGIIAFATISLVTYYIDSVPDYSSYVQLGLMTFVIFMLIGLAKKGLNAIKDTQNYQNLNNATLCGVCRFENDEDYTLIYSNDYFFEMLGFSGFASAKEIGCDNIISLSDKSAHEMIREKLNDTTVGDNNFCDMEIPLVTKDTKIIWTLANCEYDKKHDLFSISIININEMKKIEEQLRVSEEEYQIAILNSEKFILKYDIETRTLYPDAKGGKIISDTLVSVPEISIRQGRVSHESFEDYIQFYEDILSGTHDGEADLLLKNTEGLFRWYRCNFSSIFDSKKHPIRTIILCEDVTNVKEQQRLNAFHSKTDSLTGVLRRTAFQDEFKNGFTDEELKNCAIGILDIDNFKEINDTKGHDYGDRIIKDIAKTIEQSLLDGEKLGRLSGVEFVFTIRDGRDSESLDKRMRKILSDLADLNYELKVNIGLSKFVSGSNDFIILCRQANEALVKAKSNDTFYKVYSK